MGFRVEVRISGRCREKASNLTGEELLGVGLSAHEITSLPQLGTPERAEAIIEIARSGRADDLSRYFGAWVRVPDD